MFKIYPKTNSSLEGLDKFVGVINDFNGLEIQYFHQDGLMNKVSFSDAIIKAKEMISSLKEIIIHPPLNSYDIELVTLKDENIIKDELRELIDLSNRLNIDINIIFHTSINCDDFISCMDKKMKELLNIVNNTRVTILLENLFMVEENNMSIIHIAKHFDHPNLRCCFDICHAYCKAHIFKKDNDEFFDSYLNYDLCNKYVKQVHFSYTRNNDGYVDENTHGRHHDNYESIIYDLEIIKKYGMIEKNIITEVDEDEKNYNERKDQLIDIKFLYDYLNRDYPILNKKIDASNESIKGGMMYKRILMKLSGEALSGKQGFGFDDDNAKVIVRQIKELVNTNVELGLVIGGGNIWRGRENTDMDMSKSHQIGIMATVINAMYMQEILREAGIKARVITPFEISSIAEEFEKTKVNDYLGKGEVCIFAGGIGQPFFTTDTGAVLNALKINADALFLAKNVDGVYDKDPKKYDDAVKYDKITFNEVVDKKLGVMDLTAAILCMENNMNVVVFDLNTEGNIMRNVKGDITGTLVVNE